MFRFREFRGTLRSPKGKPKMTFFGTLNSYAWVMVKKCEKKPPKSMKKCQKKCKQDAKKKKLCKKTCCELGF